MEQPSQWIHFKPCERKTTSESFHGAVFSQLVLILTLLFLVQVKAMMFRGVGKGEQKARKNVFEYLQA